jgi:hypothetical protein
VKPLDEISVVDLVEVGACREGVERWCASKLGDRRMVSVVEALKIAEGDSEATSWIRKAARLDGDGDGYGDG